jgi:hypothetical protein
MRRWLDRERKIRLYRTYFDDVPLIEQIVGD